MNEITRLSLQLQAAQAALQVEVAARQRWEETRARLWEKLVKAQEDERGRLSRELHDQMGQNLAVLLLGLKSLAFSDPSPELAQRLAQLQELTNQLIRDMHRVAYELRPLALDKLGLQTGLTQYVAEWSRHSSIPVEFVSHPEEFRLSTPVETTIYRVVQEALTNVLKHAQARSVSLIVECRQEYAHLVVEDDGCGFDPEELSPASASHERLGLHGMRERVALAGGRFEVESAPGAGTTIIVRLPHERSAVPS